jgi:hypothetical protein
MKPTKPQKPYWKMTTQELAEATKEFDAEIPAERLRPLTKQERARWERTKRQPSRSIFITSNENDGLAAVLVELDRDLVRRMDAYAKTHKMTRTKFIETAIQKGLSLSNDAPAGRRSRKSA